MLIVTLKRLKNSDIWILFKEFFYLCYMNRLISHIEFLLHEHNCVIIPDLGGFVVNEIPARWSENSVLLPPACELVFNRDLTHNDGLLAESYMKTYDLSFERAVWTIECEVDKLKQALRDKNYLDLDKLGSFSLTEDNRFTYIPGDFVRPGYFGLGSVTLKNLSVKEDTPKTIPLTIPEKDRRGAFKKIGITAAAVVAIILFMFILPVSDISIDRQTANISYETEWFKPKNSAKNSHSEKVIDEVNNNFGVILDDLSIVDKTLTDNEIGGEAESVDINESKSESYSEIAETSNNNNTKTPSYYIIMGVFRSDLSSSKLLKILKEEGFNNANRLQRPERFDVYSASFNNREEAEVYLREIHKNYPKHSDAWILMK